MHKGSNGIRSKAARHAGWQSVSQACREAGSPAGMQAGGR